jgi:hypothetical protein
VSEAVTMVFDMPMPDYLASPLVSTHKIKDFAERGAHYYARRHVARTSQPSEDSEALTFGALFEDIIQGRGFDKTAYVVKPEGMTFKTKEGKAWRKEALDAGKRIVTGDELADMEAMREALEENETAIALIRDCQKQVTLQAPYAGVPGLISRPDWMSVDGCPLSGFAPYSVDLKSTMTLAKLASGRGVIDYRYDAQAAIVRRLMRQLLGTSDTQHFLLACEKRSPFRCQVIAFTPDWLDVGWQWCERHLTRLATHYERGSWPRVDSEMIALPPPPPWAMDVGTADDEAA